MPGVGFEPKISVFERGEDNSSLILRDHCDQLRYTIYQM
jgi:hypothetical protein